MRICVLGMHRSGTSITARLLAGLGVDLGPERTLLGADPDDNPRGYWEQRPIMELNDAVLERLGGPWTDPPRLHPGWHRSPTLDDLRRRARSLLDETFESEPWAWKDPRGSLTLPFWLSVEPSLRAVICVRDPREVADSWARRGPGFDARHALELWLEHTARALIDSDCVPRLVVLHDELFGDLDTQVDRLAEFAGIDPGAVTAETRSELRELVDERLWRSRAGGAPEPPAEVARLYAALRSPPPGGDEQLTALARDDEQLTALARELLASRHRAQNRDLLGYRWPRLRERARREALKPVLWRIRELLFAAHTAALNRGANRLERRVISTIGALDRLRKRWRVE